MAKPNREFKSSLFTDFFSDEGRLIETYNAIAGTDFPPTANVEFKTLKDTLYKSQRNDLAFVLEGRYIVLIEHQSTINKNMPLRLLKYIVDVFMSILPDRALYERNTVQIPTPEFIVIYNGKDEYPSRAVLKLSDAFMEQAASTKLDLEVTVYNISKGYNSELLERCVALSDYACFVNNVRDRQAEGDSFEVAIDKAIHYCIENGIMKAYLEQESAEVKRMLTMEWNEELYRQVLLEEGEERGIELGEARGIELGEARAKQESARLMKREGEPIEKIMRFTGLSVEEINLL